MVVAPLMRALAAQVGCEFDHFGCHCRQSRGLHSLGEGGGKNAGSAACLSFCAGVSSCRRL